MGAESTPRSGRHGLFTVVPGLHPIGAKLRTEVRSHRPFPVIRGLDPVIRGLDPVIPGLDPVIPGLGPVIPGLDPGIGRGTVPPLIPGSSPGMTRSERRRPRTAVLNLAPMGLVPGIGRGKVLVPIPGTNPGTTVGLGRRIPIGKGS
jgi:hypothetical protein